MRKLSLLVLVMAVMVAGARAGSDDLGSKLGGVTSDFAAGYLQPIANSFGADMNSGWFHGAQMSNGFHLYFGIKAFGANVPSADQKFSLTFADTVHVDRVINGTQYTFVVPVQLSGTDMPTVFGDDQVKGTVSGSGSIDTNIAGAGPQHIVATVNNKPLIAGLIKTSLAPLAMPQVTLGTIMGTDFTLRLIPTIKLDKYGSIGFYGVGVRHSISQYLGGENAPIDLAAGIAIQKLTIKDSLDNELLGASAFLLNVEASKSFSILTLYGGLQFEKSSMDVHYTYHATLSSNSTPLDVPINFSMDASNKFRALIGINLGLGPLNLNADYNVGTISVISGGLGFSF